MLTHAMPRCRFATLIASSAAAIAGFGFFLFDAGCGGASAPALEAPTLASALPKAPKATPPEPVDLSPVPSPPSLVLSGRWANPNASLVTLRAWSKLPTPQSAQATEALLGEPLGDLVNLDAPIDFAVAFGRVAGPKGDDGPAKSPPSVSPPSPSSSEGFDLGAPRVVVSAALTDFEAARAALAERYKLTRVADGVLRIDGLGERAAGAGDAPGERGAPGASTASGAANDAPEPGDSDEDPESRRTCELAPAYGAAPVRLLCAWGDPRALRELGPWLTRTVTRAAPSSDFHADLAMQPVKAAIGDRIKMILSIVGGLAATTMPEPGARDLVVALLGDIGDFFLDLGAASFDLDLSEPVVRARETLTFEAASSAITRLLTASPDPAAAPPQVFWQMPGDASTALFERGIDAHDFARGRELVTKALGDLLGEGGVKRADRDAIVGALGKLPSSAPCAYASGLDMAAVETGLGAWAGLSAGASAGEHFEALRGALEAGVGWQVAALDEPPTRLSAAMNELVAALNRPGVVAALRDKMKDFGTLSLHAAPMPKRTAGDPWPKGSLHFVLEVAPPDAAARGKRARAGAAKRIALHALLVPEGGRTWVAGAGDDATAASKLAAAMAGAGSTLAASAELAPLRSAVAGSGGFFSLRSLAAMWLPVVVFVGSNGDASEIVQALGDLPHQGSDPVTFWTTATTASLAQSARAVTARMEIPRGAIEDIIGVVLKHGPF
jgi:hypothetical protein